MKKNKGWTIKDLSSKGFREVNGVFHAPGTAPAIAKIVSKPLSCVRKKPKSDKEFPESGKKLPKLDLFLILVKQELSIDLTPEYRFYSERRWLFDYAYVEYKIAIEVEGGIWMEGGGAHSRPANIIRDMEKYTRANVMGWKVIRRTPQQLMSAETIELIKEAINN